MLLLCSPPWSFLFLLVQSQVFHGDSVVHFVVHELFELFLSSWLHVLFAFRRADDQGVPASCVKFERYKPE